MRQAGAVQETLTHRAAAPAQEIGLPFRFHTFSHRLQAERLGHGKDHLDNRWRLLVAFEG